MGTLKASILVVTGLAALGGGAVVLRDGGSDRLVGLLPLGQAPDAPVPAALAPPMPEVSAPPTFAQSRPSPPIDPMPEIYTGPPRPAIDVVRLEPDGTALISGTGQPGAEVEVLVDGLSIWSGTTNGQGEFVAFVDLPISPIARMMWLRSRQGDGAAVQSDGSIVLAPSPQAEAPDMLVQGRDTQRASGPLVAHPPQAEDAARAPPARPQSTRLVADSAESPAAKMQAVETKPADAPRASTQTSGNVAATAPGSLVVLESDSAGVRPISPAPVAPEQGLALDTVRYGARGEVILSGRGEAAQDLAIYLDGQVAALARTTGQGDWQAVLSDVPSGTYRLRADLTDTTGRVAARVQLPFRRESPEVVEAARIAASEADQSAALLTVQPGFSLWAIARDRYGDGFQYVAVYDANSDQIVDPDLIYPGQVLTLPARQDTPPTE